MLNKTSVLLLLSLSNIALAVNETGVPINPNGPMGATPSVIGGVNTNKPPTEDKLNVLNIKKGPSAQSIAEQDLENQIKLRTLAVKLKEQDVRYKKAEKELADLDNPNRVSNTPLMPSMPGINVPALNMPNFNVAQNPIKVAPVSSTPTVSTHKKSKQDKVKEEVKEIKEVAFEALPLVKGYGGFSKSLEATLIHSNGSEAQVQVGDVILPNVTISAITDRGVFVKNVNAQMKLAMWTKQANSKLKEKEKEQESQPTQMPSTIGPIIYPGITPAIQGEFSPLKPGNGEIIIPKTVGNR